MNRLGIVLFVVVCFGMAAGVYVIGIQQPTQAFDEAVTVEGTVQSAEVEREVTAQETKYRPVITYEYRYDGRTYTNDEYQLVTGFSSMGGHRAEQIVDSYAAGDSVTVYVVPDEPSHSFLKRGSVGFFFYAVIGFLVLLGAFGIVAFEADRRGAEWIVVK